MSSTLLEQHLDMIRGMREKGSREKKPKNRKSIIEKASQELKQKEVRRNKIVEVLGKQRRKQHTLGEVKKVVKAQRKLQKAPRRKQVAEISK